MKRIICFIIAALLSLTATAQNPRLDPLFERADNYALQKEYAKSNQCYEQIIAELPAYGEDSLIPAVRELIEWNLVDSLADLAEIYAEQKDYSKSNQYYESIIAKLPSIGGDTLIQTFQSLLEWNHVESLLDTAEGLTLQKEYDKSNECYAKVLSKLPIPLLGGDSLIIEVKDRMSINRLFHSSDLAKSYSQLGDYVKSNNCYANVITELKNLDMEELIPSVQDSIAANCIRLQHMAMAYRNDKNYAKSNECLNGCIKAYPLIGWDDMIDKPNEIITLNRIDSITEEARFFSKEKEFVKSNDCYEKVLMELQTIEGSEKRIAKVRNSMSINYGRLGNASIKRNEYEDARHHYQTAVEYAIPNSEAHKMALRGVGNTFSWQVTELEISHTVANVNHEKAISYCLEAEHYYDLAMDTEKRLEQQRTRADILADLNRIEEAETLYLQTIEECGSNDSLNRVRGKSLYKLGCIKIDKEQYKDAIEFLEQGYMLCLDAGDKLSAHFAANNLADIYKKHSPDADKSSQWQQRAVALKEDIPSFQDMLKRNNQRKQNKD